MVGETKLSEDDWDEIDRQMLQDGVYRVFDEVAELETEEDRYWFLYSAIHDEDSKNLEWFHDEAKEIIRKSRTLYGDPVPNDEFFGM